MKLVQSSRQDVSEDPSIGFVLLLFNICGSPLTTTGPTGGPVPVGSEGGTGGLKISKGWAV